MGMNSSVVGHTLLDSEALCRKGQIFRFNVNVRGDQCNLIKVQIKVPILGNVLHDVMQREICRCLPNEDKAPFTSRSPDDL